MPDTDRDEHDYLTEVGGHLWRDTRGPDSACERCGLFYSRWSGDRCNVAPDCEAVHTSGVRCGREAGHPYKHVTLIEWSVLPEENK